MAGGKGTSLGVQSESGVLVNFAYREFTRTVQKQQKQLEMKGSSEKQGFNFHQKVGVGSLLGDMF